MVTLYVRVWIETVMLDRARISLMVTLYVRVWIETSIILRLKFSSLRSPST